MLNRIVFICLSVLLISCSEDDDGADALLEGKWILTEVTCFCYFPDDYDFGLTQIQFDTDNNQMTITNSGELNFIDDSGTYSYSRNGYEITLENRSYTFLINGASLRLTFVDQPNIADDEVSYSFTRE